MAKHDRRKRSSQPPSSTRVPRQGPGARHERCGRFRSERPLPNADRGGVKRLQGGAGQRRQPDRPRERLGLRGPTPGLPRGGARRPPTVSPEAWLSRPPAGVLRGAPPERRLGSPAPPWSKMRPSPLPAELHDPRKSPRQAPRRRCQAAPPATASRGQAWAFGSTPVARVCRGVGPGSRWWSNGLQHVRAAAPGRGFTHRGFTFCARPNRL